MNDLHAKLAEAKSKLPLDVLMQKLGYGDEYQMASCKPGDAKSVGNR